MNMNFSWSQLARKCLQFSVMIVVSLLFMLSAMDSAIAFGNSNSNPSQGTAQMNQLQQQSKKAVRSEPRSSKVVKKQAQRGPNEVQGDADLHGMNVPDNSRQAKTVRQQAEEALEKVTPGN